MESVSARDVPSGGEIRGIKSGKSSTNQFIPIARYLEAALRVAGGSEFADCH